MFGKNPKLDWLEELANSVTHGVGLVLSIAGLGVMVTVAAVRGTRWHVISCGIYGITLVLLYAASTLYHSFRQPGVKRIFRIVDHCAIYLLLAGTYTPFLLVSLRNAGSWIWMLFALVWLLAIVGMIGKVFFVERFVVASTISYMAMGWLVLLITKPLMEYLPQQALFWLIGGGLFYTVGTVFFGWERLRLSHAIWHLFVLLGSICHYLSVYLYVLPKS